MALETPLCSCPEPVSDQDFFVIKVNFPLVNTGHVPFLVQCPEFGTINHVLATLHRNKGVECPTLMQDCITEENGPALEANVEPCLRRKELERIVA